VNGYLGEASVIDQQRAADAGRRHHLSCQSIAQAAVAPGALVDQLLQGLLVIDGVVGVPVDGSQTAGHGFDAFACAVEQEAANVDLGPASAPGITKPIGHQFVQEGREFRLQLLQSFDVHTGIIRDRSCRSQET
jgi:hypothetical protein